MKINDKYSIESDSNNVILVETKTFLGTGKGRPSTKQKGDTYTVQVAYFSTTGEPLRDLLHYITNHEIFGDGLKDLESVNKKQQEIYALINTFRPTL